MAKPKARHRKAEHSGPMVALYALDAGTLRGDAVRSVMAGLGVRVRTIAPERLGDPVGAVAGVTGMRPARKPYAGEAPAFEFMLVCNMPSKFLDQVLSALRQADASIACKAQVTKHNRLWPVHVLMAEVAREHAAMQQTAAGAAGRDAAES